MRKENATYEQDATKRTPLDIKNALKRINELQGELDELRGQITSVDTTLTNQISSVNSNLTNSKVSKLGGYAQDEFGSYNFNDYVRFGAYRIQNLADYTNAPSSEANYGQTLIVRGSADTVAQLVFPYANSGYFFYRCGNAIGKEGVTPTFQPWRRYSASEWTLSPTTIECADTTQRTWVSPSFAREVLVEYGNKNTTQSYAGGTIVLPVNSGASKPCFLPLYSSGTLACVVYIFASGGNIVVQRNTGTNTVLFKFWYR